MHDLIAVEVERTLKYGRVTKKTDLKAREKYNGY